MIYKLNIYKCIHIRMEHYRNNDEMMHTWWTNYKEIEEVMMEQAGVYIKYDLIRSTNMLLALACKTENKSDVRCFKYRLKSIHYDRG